MSSYKLFYFNGRGRAEVARLIFAVAGEKYEDIRFERADWPKLKGEMPLGQVPVLEYNGVKLPQSLSIARFLAKQFGLAGKDNFDQGKVDAVVDTLTDSLNKFVVARFESDPEKKEVAMKAFITEDLPKFMKSVSELGKLYGESGPFFVGNQLTWADLLFFELSDNYLQADPNCLNDFPWLQANRENVGQNPKVAEHVKNRQVTPF